MRFPTLSRGLRLAWRAPLLAGLVLASCIGSRVSSPAPAIDLTNQHGDPTSLGDFRGKVVLLSFLYTHCPDTCPAYLSHFYAAATALEGSPDQGFAVVVVTVDPERDTVDHLRDFTALWPANWFFLTGRPRDVARVWSEYDIYVEREMRSHRGEPDEYGVIHTAKVVLIDREGYVAGELTGDWAPAELIENVQRLLAGEDVTSQNSLLERLMGIVRRCGSSATASPAAFLGIVLLVMLPGLILSTLLLRTFLRAGDEQRLHR